MVSADGSVSSLARTPRAPRAGFPSIIRATRRRRRSRAPTTRKALATVVVRQRPPAVAHRRLVDGSSSRRRCSACAVPAAASPHRGLRQALGGVLDQGVLPREPALVDQRLVARTSSSLSDSRRSRLRDSSGEMTEERVLGGGAATSVNSTCWAQARRDLVDEEHGLVARRPARALAPAAPAPAETAERRAAVGPAGSIEAAAVPPVPGGQQRDSERGGGEPGSRSRDYPPPRAAATRRELARDLPGGVERASTPTI